MKNLKKFNEEISAKFDDAKLNFLKKLIVELIDIKETIEKRKSYSDRDLSLIDSLMKLKKSEG
jgi:hypothetical protein